MNSDLENDMTADDNQDPMLENDALKMLLKSKDQRIKQLEEEITSLKLIIANKFIENCQNQKSYPAKQQQSYSSVVKKHLRV